MAAKRFTKAEELRAAVEGWAREKLPTIGPGAITRIRAHFRGRPGIDRRQEARARRAHENLQRALTAAIAVGEQAKGDGGYATIARILSGRLRRLAADPLVASPERFPGIGDASSGWNSLTQIVIEAGSPGFLHGNADPRRLYGRWGLNAPTLDELVAFAILAGAFDLDAARRAVLQARRHQVQSAAGATVADGVDVLRKAVRAKLAALTLEATADDR